MLIHQPVLRLVDAAGASFNVSLIPRRVEVRIVDEPVLSAAQIRAFGGVAGQRVSAVLEGTLSAPLIDGTASFADLAVRVGWLNRVVQAEFSVEGSSFRVLSSPFAVLATGLDPVPVVADASLTPDASAAWIFGSTSTEAVVAGLAGLAGVVISLVMFHVVETRTQQKSVPQSQEAGPQTAKVAAATILAKAAAEDDAKVSDGGPVRERPTSSRAASRGETSASAAGTSLQDSQGSERSAGDSELGDSPSGTPRSASSGASDVSLRAQQLVDERLGIQKAAAARAHRAKLQRAWAIGDESDGPAGRGRLPPVEALAMDEQAERIVAALEADGRLPLSPPRA